jgi:hypothetical protein
MVFGMERPSRVYTFGGGWRAEVGCVVKLDVHKGWLGAVVEGCAIWRWILALVGRCGREVRAATNRVLI